MGTTDAASHIGASCRSEEPGHETAAVSVAADFHLLGRLADGLKGLLGVHGADVDIAVCQGGDRRAGARVGEHHVVISMG